MTDPTPDLRRVAEALATRDVDLASRIVDRLLGALEAAGLLTVPADVAREFLVRHFVHGQDRRN